MTAVVWLRTAAEIEALSHELVARSRARLDRWVAHGAAAGGLAALKELAEEDAAHDSQRALCEFPKDVAPDKALRDAANAATQRLRAYDVDKATRKDVFDALVALDEAQPALGPEWRRYLDRLLRDRRRLGLHLPETERAQVKQLQEQIASLGLDFSKNLNEENTTFLFTAAELDGLPADVLSGLPRVDDADGQAKHRVSLKYPDYFPAMKFVKNPDVRRKLQTAFDARCKDTNTAMLETLIQKRAQMAAVLGYPSHAAYITAIRMAGTPDRVEHFLKDLSDRLAPLVQHEMDALLELKRAECAELVLPYDGRINAWDFRYYLDKFEKTRYQVSDKVKEYFPLPKVMAGMLDMYQQLLGLIFKHQPKQDELIWHPDVELYEVVDAVTGTHMGFFYLDLHPREGKYGHAACFGLRPGCVRLSGERQAAVAACVANFSRGVDGKPALLMHDEVETLFHEFGHVMHQICAQAVVPYFAGTRVERDFVEAPSQMLENWVWERESLQRMSEHYETREPMPDEILKPLQSSRFAGTGLLNRRQILFATFDQHIHTRASADTAAVYADLCKSIWGIPATEGTNMPATFGHMVGYDAQYYGYLWSEVFSMDMFETRFRHEGILSAEVGMSYRRNILEPGGSLDASEMLRRFLGRDPKPDAFLRSRGLSERVAHL